MTALGRQLPFKPKSGLEPLDSSFVPKVVLQQSQSLQRET
jgi:hypothetical protein